VRGLKGCVIFIVLCVLINGVLINNFQFFDLISNSNCVNEDSSTLSVRVLHYYSDCIIHLGEMK
jgi:hypothetical protein